MWHQSYVLTCTEITVSSPPVIFPKSSCNIHLLRCPWLITARRNSSGLSRGSKLPDRFVRAQLTTLSKVHNTFYLLYRCCTLVFMFPSTNLKFCDDVILIVSGLLIGCLINSFYASMHFKLSLQFFCTISCGKEYVS